MTDLDVVLFGATGYTGALTAEYLATNAPSDLRWGLAGRSRDRLAALRDRLGLDVAVIAADVEDEASMRRLAESTRVLITTAGPYLRYGEPAVAACALTGTDYVDITGEAEFVDVMYARHHATAVRTGARLVHACGFDSIPHDLGALFAVRHLPEGQPIRLRGYVQAGGTVSGGTLDSAVTVLARSGHAAQALAERHRIEPRTERRARVERGRPHRAAEVGAWVLPLPTIDRHIVVRSARALDRYGPEFSYGHYWVAGNAVRAAALTGAVVGASVMVRVPPARALVRKLRPAGSGPSVRQRGDGWFRVRFCGVAGDCRVVTQVRGGDPGYGETSKMLAESALCLAQDQLVQTAGQVTTAVAMGDALRVRLERAGISFQVVESVGPTR